MKTRDILIELVKFDREYYDKKDYAEKVFTEGFPYFDSTREIIGNLIMKLAGIPDTDEGGDDILMDGQEIEEALEKTVDKLLAYAKE